MAVDQVFMVQYTGNPTQEQVNEVGRAIEDVLEPGSSAVVVSDQVDLLDRDDAVQLLADALGIDPEPHLSGVEA